MAATQFDQAASTTLDPAHFETIYADAQGDRSRIAWADGRAHPALVCWLNVVAPSLVRSGARVVVVGCGLGEDARELVHRGYDVTAFDCSPTAIEWARRIDPENRSCYLVGDLFDPPGKWRHRFDLVVEINTIQALEPPRRAETMAAISELLSPRGHLLVICRHSELPADLDQGPPWPLTEHELELIAAEAHLVPEQPIAAFIDDEEPPVARMRALFRRA